MTEQQPADDEPIVVDQTDKRSLVPFVVAAAIAAIVLAGIVAGAIFAPAENNVTEADRISAAAANYIDARSNSEARPPAGVACSGFDEEAAGLTEQLGGEQPDPAAELVGVTDQRINGDRGRATVEVQVEGAETSSTWDFRRVDDRWLVCAP